MKTIETIYAVLLLVLCISLTYKVKALEKEIENLNYMYELNERLDDLRDTWILATTPASGIEEIEVEDLKTPDGAWKPRKETE